MSAAAFHHTPYDGSHPLFRIGLAPLDIANWIEVDEHLARYLMEKERLNHELPQHVFAAEEGTQDAQREVLALVSQHVTAAFPDIYRQNGNVIEIGATGRFVALDDDEQPPLLKAAMLVQEDLVLLRRDDTGWRLVAASLCFPSSWRLAEKYGQPLQEVHQPVPGFGPGTRNAGMIERIFDNLQPDLPVWRMNWSLYSDDRLYHADRSQEHLKRLSDGITPEISFLRVEHQTLRKLAASGFILFTIRIHVDPLASLARHAERRRIASGLIESLKRLDDEQVAYKGIANGRDRLVTRLREIECS
ncbi:MAG: DUF3445 domain-containing protein [Rhizobiaceae bacterium]